MEVAIGIAVAVALLVGALCLWGHLGYRRHVRKLQRIAQGLAQLEAIDPHPDLSALPEPARRLLNHAIGDDARPARAVRFSMEGEIRPGKDAGWMPFRATEVLRVPGGFCWRASLKGPVKLTGGDHYLKNEGGVHFWLYGIFHAVRSRGTDVVRSAAGRAAMEAFWFPPSLLPGEHVEWLESEGDVARCKVTVGEETLTAEFRIDEDGRVVSVKGERWGNDTEDQKWQNIPFGAEFSEEKTVQGYTIPTRMLAGWWYGTEKWEQGQFMKARITEVEFL